MLNLSEFEVQGWQADPDDFSVRHPMEKVKIWAVDGVQAAKTYARCYQIPDKFWWNVGPKPPVVVRVQQ